MGVEGVADYLHPFYVREKARMYGDLEQLLRTHHGEPKEWAEDVEAVMAALEAALTDRSRFYPRDMGPPTDPKGAFAAMLDLIGRYGELLEYWPDIVQTAKALREKGIRVSV
jgi:hypothetical protein